jgi:hypothetical protein
MSDLGAEDAMRTLHAVLRVAWLTTQMVGNQEDRQLEPADCAALSVVLEVARDQCKVIEKALGLSE